MLIYNYYFAILILAIIFYFISNKNPSILLAIIIIIILGYNYFSIIAPYNSNKNYENQIASLETDVEDKLYYLNNDKILIDLILNIRFIRIFDIAKYSYIVIQNEKLIKLYIFMLGDRYDIKERFTSFLNIRNNIINEMYSTYLIIPNKFKYIYNLNPYEELKYTIENYIKHTRKMIIILKRYAYGKKNIQYLQDTKYKPYTKDNNIDNNVF